MSLSFERGGVLDGFGGLLAVIILVGFAYLVALAPVAMIEGDAETPGDYIAGGVGLAIWVGGVAAAGAML